MKAELLIHFFPDSCSAISNADGNKVVLREDSFLVAKQPEQPQTAVSASQTRVPNAETGSSL